MNSVAFIHFNALHFFNEFYNIALGDGLFSPLNSTKQMFPNQLNSY